MCKSNVSVVWRKCQHFFWWLGWSFRNLDQHWWQVTGCETLHLNITYFVRCPTNHQLWPLTEFAAVILSFTFDPERSLIMTFFCWTQSLQEHCMDWGHSDEAYDTSGVSVATWCFMHSKSKRDFFTMSRTLVWSTCTCLLNVSGKILQSKHWTLCLHKYPTTQCSRWHSLADSDWEAQQHQYHFNVSVIVRFHFEVGTGYHGNYVSPTSKEALRELHGDTHWVSNAWSKLCQWTYMAKYDALDILLRQFRTLRDGVSIHACSMRWLPSK